MCCKVLSIDALSKPADQWCPNCQVGQGCSIYAQRPAECSTFNCMWLIDVDVPEALAPRDSRMVLAGTTGAIIIHVDTSRRGAWRKPPFHPLFRRWATVMAPRGARLLVREGREYFAILPDRDKALGILQPGWILVPTQREMAGSVSYDIELARADDPRAGSALRII
jgi:hypothetical protein